MTSEVLSCCCGGGFCCPCNPLYGGRTSWQVSWTGSVTLTPNLSCACVDQWDTPFGFGYGNALMLTRSLSIGGRSFASTWLNTTDPLNAQFCSMTGFTDPVAGAPTLWAQDYFILLPNGPCTTDPGFPEFDTGIRVRARVVVYPPVYPCPTNTLTQPLPWRVDAGIMGVANFRFNGSTSCTNPGTFVLDLGVSTVDGSVGIPSAAGTVGCAGSPLACSVSYSAGSVTIT